MASVVAECTEKQLPLSMIIPVAAGSPLVSRTLNDVKEQYGVEISSVLKPIRNGVIRDMGTEITPGSALEVKGPEESVLNLYRAARQTR